MEKASRARWLFYCRDIAPRLSIFRLDLKTPAADSDILKNSFLHFGERAESSFVDGKMNIGLRAKIRVLLI